MEREYETLKATNDESQEQDDANDALFYENLQHIIESVGHGPGKSAFGGHLPGMGTKILRLVIEISRLEPALAYPRAKMIRDDG